MGQRLDVRLTQHVIEVFHRGRRVASHRRAFAKGQYVTDVAHRPKAHQKQLEWTPSRLVHWGESIGPNTGILVARILERKKHPEQGYRACLGLLNLSKQYPRERMEAAALRALTIDSCSYRSVKSMLQTRMEQTYLPLETSVETTPQHSNIRGADYYKAAMNKTLH
ncbi:MAG: hypothetical protein OWS03_00800 [Alicyclobacillaceae bacterium]|nr:hypothetical protein [Alicyclobacillaceae bacterium]